MRALRPLPKATLSIAYLRTGDLPGPVEYLARIFEAELPDTKSVIVLLNIAKHLGNTSNVGWPSFAGIAEETKLSPHSVQRAVRWLVRARMLQQRLQPDGPPHYTILWHNIPYKRGAKYLTWAGKTKRKSPLDVLDI